MKLQNEYLIILDKETSSGFYKLCNSIKRFNEFIEDDKEFRIQKNKIFMGKNSYGYQVKRGEVKGKKQNFFYMTLKFDDDAKYLSEYREFLRKLKNIFHENKSIVETLRDDLSFHYSQLSYSLIHEIENLMRKFITYFMITNVGKNWVSESSPAQIKEALGKSKRKEYRDILQQLDFIHLGDFLFKAYYEEDISNLFEKIRKLDKEDDMSFSDFKSYIPQSNWDKYFKAKVDCDDIYLKKRWKLLYDLRNKIAHTSHFTIGNYEDIQNLVSEIKEKLEKAFVNIDTIELREEDKEQLSEKIATNVNENIGIFLHEWNKLEKQIDKLANNKNRVIFTKSLSIIKSKGYLEGDLIDKIDNLRIFRNNISHDIDIINNEEIQTNITNIKRLNNILQSSWGVEVLEAFKEFNGEATLNEIYSVIEKNTRRELTSSWKSSVRKAIYHCSSDADLYLGKDDLYVKMGKGKWKLRDYTIKNPAT